MYFVPKKDGTGNRPTNIADARKGNLLPGVTQIVKDTLKSYGLEKYFIRQAVEAIATAPDVPGEDTGAKIERVIYIEAQQDEEARIARDRGTEIHDALESLAKGNQIPEELKPWTIPIWQFVSGMGKVMGIEKVLCGNGYAGRTDLIIGHGLEFILVDYKTAKKFPEKEPWDEQKLQLSAYARAFKDKYTSDETVRVGNLYISTVEPGKFMWLEHKEWEDTYANGFSPLFKVWKWLHKFTPVNV